MHANVFFLLLITLCSSEIEHGLSVIFNVASHTYKSQLKKLDAYSKKKILYAVDLYICVTGWLKIEMWRISTV